MPLIAPCSTPPCQPFRGAGTADNLTSLNFLFRHFGRLQDIEATAIEKERMIPKQVVQFPDGGMVIGKYLGMELAQGLVYLCRAGARNRSPYCSRTRSDCRKSFEYANPS